MTQAKGKRLFLWNAPRQEGGLGFLNLFNAPFAPDIPQAIHQDQGLTGPGFFTHFIQLADASFV